MLVSHIVKRLEMKLFRADANDLCSEAPMARSNFIRFWQSKGFKDNAEFSDPDGSFGSGSDTTMESAAFSEDSDPEIPRQIPTANSYEDMMLMEYNIGLVDIHVENLTSPHPSRLTRILDHNHVQGLLQSFAENDCGQMVILQGMLTDCSISHNSLIVEGSGEVEVLGGNHTREALQTLHRKGMLQSSAVRVNLYKPLPRLLALKLGFQHNTILHEKKKPVTFIDKIRLMRECRPTEDMSSRQSLGWRDSLVTVFGVKDRRKLQQSYGLHLSLAVLQSHLWTKLLLAGEKITITEKFFRGMVRLSRDVDKESCLDVLLSEGVKVFKQRVKEFIDAGHVKSSKMKGTKRKGSGVSEGPVVDDASEETNEDGQEEIQLSLEQTENNWEEKYRQLLERYEQRDVKLQLEQYKQQENGNVGRDEAEVKRKRCTKNKFTKGEKVMAFWREESGEESWQEATVLFAFADGRCRLRWTSDGMVSNARPHEVQKSDFRI